MSHNKYRKENEQIDIVYTWVDGDDPLLQEKKKKYIDRTTSDTLEDAVSDTRYKNIEELRYSLRSVYLFMPWVHKIYIVVDDCQKPYYINEEHPKIEIVTHSTIFPDSSYLPTFNSQSIETNLHRIPGLLNKFIYFNDDFFVGRYIDPSDLISEDGRPYIFTDFLSFINYYDYLPENSHTIASRNTNSFIKSVLQKQRIYNQWHHPVLLEKQMFIRAEELFPELFKFNMSFKFRSIQQYHIIALINILSYELGYKIEKEKLYSILYINISYTEEDTVLKWLHELNNILLPFYLNRIYKNRPYYFCLNNITPSHQNIDLIKKFLEYYYPNKCPYEK